MTKYKYMIDVEIKRHYTNQGRIKHPRFKRQISYWNKNMARKYKEHLEAVYGKNNVRNFKLKNPMK